MDYWDERGAATSVGVYGHDEAKFGWTSYVSRRVMLTVVIPAYNVEDFVASCMRSVLDQATPDGRVRIVVVVDGATDETFERARMTAHEYPHHDVKIISQDNQGLSGARNTGIGVASTEYITFLDADDYWLPGYLNTILPELERLKPDVIEYNAIVVDELGRHLFPMSCASGEEGLVRRIDLVDFISNFRCFAWSRVYRVALFAARAFPVNRRFEDTGTIPWLYWRAQCLVSIGKTVIAYRQRPGSILASPTERDIHDLASTLDEAIDMYQKTRHDYWRDVSLRVFQQACSRIERLPLNKWLEAIRIARSQRMELLPLPQSVVRRLQVKETFFYICLLFLKRRTIDQADRWCKRLVHYIRTIALP